MISLPPDSTPIEIHLADRRIRSFRDPIEMVDRVYSVQVRRMHVSTGVGGKEDLLGYIVLVFSGPTMIGRRLMQADETDLEPTVRYIVDGPDWRRKIMEERK